MNIHGLVLDSVTRHAPGRLSAYSTSVLEYGVARFPDGWWLVTLPLGQGIGASFTAALAEARSRQRGALRGAHSGQGIGASVTAALAEARSQERGALRGAQ
jgi:hypothetical protein